MYKYTERSHPKISRRRQNSSSFGGSRIWFVKKKINWEINVWITGKNIFFEKQFVNYWLKNGNSRNHHDKCCSVNIQRKNDWVVNNQYSNLQQQYVSLSIFKFDDECKWTIVCFIIYLFKKIYMIVNWRIYILSPKTINHDNWINKCIKIFII